MGISSSGQGRRSLKAEIGGSSPPIPTKKGYNGMDSTILNLSASDFRSHIETHGPIDDSFYFLCIGCRKVHKFTGKWLIRNNRTEIVPTNEYRCECGYTTSPREMQYHIASI